MCEWTFQTFIQCSCVVAVFFLHVGLMQGEVCTVARQKCLQRDGCNYALVNYMQSCGALIHGETSRCSSSCQKALISLLSTQDQQGLNFMACDCNNETYCVTQRRRIDVCSSDVLKVMRHINDKNKAIPCSLAELICVVDSTCRNALRFYTDYCRRMWRGHACTPRCNNSLTILYRQEKAEKLKTCICDGSEGYDQVRCQAIHNNTQRLCFGSYKPQVPMNSPVYSVSDGPSATPSNKDAQTTCMSNTNNNSHNQSGAMTILALLLWILSVL